MIPATNRLLHKAKQKLYHWIIRSLLRERVAMVDRDLQQIRNKGRQYFLAKPPSNFSKIIHDYTDEPKGFMVWKDMLEERVL